MSRASESARLRASPKGSGDLDSTARLPAPNMSENIPAYSGKCASIRHTHWVLSSAAMPRSDCR